MRSYLVILPLLGFVGGVACDEHPDHTPLGAFDITTTAATTATTSDGWNATFTKMLVHVSAVTVAGGDQVVAATAGPLILDQAAPGSKDLLSATVRVARPWEEVSLELGPATLDAVTLVPPVVETDRDRMQRDGLSLYFEGTLTKGSVTKKLELAFKSDTLDKDCAGEVNGGFLRGLIVPPDGIDTANVTMSPAALFADDLAASVGGVTGDGGGAVLRGEAIANGDANADGVVTTDELAKTPLDDVRAATGAAYGVGDQTDIADLGAFLEALSRKYVSSFRTNGGCLAEAKTEAQP
jgi:hypothetical protein